ncbi:hypothetical protein [Streptomyces sp. NPDC006368]
MKLFWKVIEEVRPDQADLRLDEETITHSTAVSPRIRQYTP